MRAFRLLALTLFGVVLFIQGTAYASAQPARPAEASSDCQEMAMAGHAPAGESEKGCCDMQMACLAGMNCISPLFPPAEAAGDPAVHTDVNDYLALTVARTATFGSGPEPPPPQIRS
jgi:hypothetical protein